MCFCGCASLAQPGSSVASYDGKDLCQGKGAPAYLESEG